MENKETLWENDKLLVTSNFSFSHNVFHSYISLVHQNAVPCDNGLNDPSCYDDLLSIASWSRIKSPFSMEWLIHVKEQKFRNTNLLLFYDALLFSFPSVFEILTKRRPEREEIFWSHLLVSRLGFHTEKYHSLLKPETERPLLTFYVFIRNIFWYFALKKEKWILQPSWRKERNFYILHISFFLLCTFYNYAITRKGVLSAFILNNTCIKIQQVKIITIRKQRLKQKGRPVFYIMIFHKCQVNNISLLFLLSWRKSFFSRSFNPFPHNDTFLCPWETSLLKTLWEKEKLLVTSNFSFSHSVFYLFG